MMINSIMYNKGVFMKKYSLCIVSTIFLIVSTLYMWYSDYLFNKFFVISILPLFLFFFLFNFLVLISLISIFKNKNYINILTVFILFIMLLIYLFFPYREAKLSVEWNKYKDKRNKVIELVRKDKISYLGDSKNAILPSNLEKVSSDGTIYVYKNEKENQIIGFWIFRGIDESVLLIYSTEGKKAIEEYETISKIKKIDTNWYYVETD